MGSLMLPTSGWVYVDAQVAIYTVDKHPEYAPVCRPLWNAVRTGSIVAVSSELVILETLVGPLRDGDTTRAALREDLWKQANTRLLPVSQSVLREAARLRAAQPALKTPDAIHAATSLLHECKLFVTNDLGFRRMPGLPLALLDDVLAEP